MAYVRPTDPLPRNSQDPQTACEARYAKAVVDNMETSVRNAYNASMMIAGPNSFAQFGPAVVIDVARSQNARAAAGVAPVFSPGNPRGELQAAPRVLPLNVSEDEYNSCCTSKGPPQPMQLAPQVPIMPERMPASVVVPTMAVAPKYKNLCWALRNGAVDPTQFNPQEFEALSYRCSQLGYAGACPSPPLVALYLDQQLRAGTLPHISVAPSDLDAIPHAPDLTAVYCASSYAQGGMSGMTGYSGHRGRRGMGAPWGDAGSLPTTAGWPAPSTPVNWKTILLLAAAGLGMYAAAKR